MILNIALLTVVVGLSYTIFIPMNKAAAASFEAVQIARWQAKIKQQFFDLVVKGKFAISDA